MFGQATDTEESVARGMNVGVILIKDGEDFLDITVVLEDQIVLHDIKDFSKAVAMLMDLLYVLNIYPKELRYTFEVILKSHEHPSSHEHWC